MSKKQISTLFDQLIDYIRQKNIEEATKLVEDEKELLYFVDNSGRLAIHWACSTGFLPFIELALRTDEELASKVDESGWTPFMIASSAGHLDVVKSLLSSSHTNVNHRYLNYAKFYYYRNDNGQVSLHYACSKNHIKIAELIVQNGGELNVRDKFGHTPLHRAASLGHEKIMQFLLSREGINIDIQDNEGQTPLHVACEDGNESAALYLVNKGASITIQNKEEKTPLEMTKDFLLRKKLKTAAERFE